MPMDINNNEEQPDLLEICVHLHNLFAERVQIKQILQMYVPTGRSADDRELFELDDMLFKDVQLCCSTRSLALMIRIIHTVDPCLSPQNAHSRVICGLQQGGADTCVGSLQAL